VCKIRIAIFQRRRGAADRPTVKNWASEEHQELDEQVLLLGGDFVPAHASPAGLNIVVGDTLLDVGIEPVVGYDAIVLVSCLAGSAGTPELQSRSVSEYVVNSRSGVCAYLPPGLALVRVGGIFALVGLTVGGLGISVGRNVLLECGVLVCADAVSLHAV